MKYRQAMKKDKGGGALETFYCEENTLEQRVKLAAAFMHARLNYTDQRCLQYDRGKT